MNPDSCVGERICVNCCFCDECRRKVGTRHLDVCACPTEKKHWWCRDCRPATDNLIVEFVVPHYLPSLLIREGVSFCGTVYMQEYGEYSGEIAFRETHDHEIWTFTVRDVQTNKMLIGGYVDAIERIVVN